MTTSSTAENPRFTLNALPLGDIVEQLFERALHARLTLPLDQAFCPGPGDDDVVVIAREAVGERPEGLAHRPLHPVPLDRLPNLAPDRDPEAPGAFAALVGAAEGVEDEEAVAAGGTLAVDAVEVAAAREPAAARRAWGFLGAHLRGE